MNDAAIIGRRGVRLFRIAGIEIRLDYSWFIIFFLVLWALIFGYFPSNYPGQSQSAYIIAGIFAGLLLFASILFHEIMHSLTALRSGIKIPDITLFIFGGVSRISEEAKEPATELKIALAGPLSSLVLALVFWLLQTLPKAPGFTGGILKYLAVVNLMLGIFNLIPAFPLDGGRVFRALAWKKTGSLLQATRQASELGKWFGVLLMIAGAVEIFSGYLIGGIWLVFIGMFLRGIARQGYEELLLRRSLEGVAVKDAMNADVVSVPANISVRELVDDYFIKYCYGGFPVVHGDIPSGIVTLADIRKVPGPERDSLTVQAVMEPADEHTSIVPGASLADALRKMTVESVSRLLVIENNHLRGMVTKSAVIRFLQVRESVGKA